EDECDRAEHRALADTVCRRIEKGAERRRLAAESGERPVEDVEDRSDDEELGANPVVEPRVPVLEEDDNRPDETEGDTGRREDVRGDTRARQADHRSRRERSRTGGVALLDAVKHRRFSHVPTIAILLCADYSSLAMCRRTQSRSTRAR